MWPLQGPEPTGPPGLLQVLRQGCGRVWLWRGLAGEVATHDNPLADGQEMSKAEALLVQARQRNLGAEPEATTTVYVDESGAAVDNFDL